MPTDPPTTPLIARELVVKDNTGSENTTVQESEALLVTEAAGVILITDGRTVSTVTDEAETD